VALAVEPGSILTLDLEKPAAGGRMLARHHGQVAFVSGAIPGERVAARVERVTKGLIFADTVDVQVASPDRRMPEFDWRCGGNVLAHISYPRQLQIKGEILKDAFGRIARVPLSAVPDVIGSPEHGYRMRARLHVHDGRLGFYREGTHHLCDAARTGQLLPETAAWLSRAQSVLQSAAASVYGGLAAIDLAENVAGTSRACHLSLHAGVDASRYGGLASGLVGLSAQRVDSPRVERIAGTPSIVDMLRVGDDDSTALRLERDVRSFFQGNRFLLERLVHQVAEIVPSGPVVDLYAGVGLFGLSLTAAGRAPVTVVEGDPVSGSDLEANARPFGDRVRVERSSVETYLDRASRTHGASTFVVDPPRTGLSKEALAGIVRACPQTLVYVSCDVATLARDARQLLDAGYELRRLTGIDLFPNTAHVESIAAFSRVRPDTPKRP
jgi:23S rRNA (uracil1939-C5)-methyltransferase